ncbi:electron transport complex subunit E [Sedimenticola thiotaurini]|uniref:Ion-translocating oxidoreductase complex subunit E n=1 Tax=Sedimenticola thiotaurini TaxID=1543721 RepID=A0A0F7K1A0_9GAMM|nr:electron transport complex subunit E [Sedimenticola thiotaurini]AKH21657.1 electron transport complex RsxE subunit [Sedimenticola thiotaurini]
MSEQGFIGLMKNGLWHNNQGLVALLGLCPLLAVTSTASNGLGLGLATMATLMVTNLIVSVTRHWLRSEIRIPMFVLIIACVVTAIELLMSAHLHQLYLALGIFLPLIVTNCAIIGRAEAFASKQPVRQALIDGFAMGLGFLAVLVVLGCVRELIGYGTLFRGADSLFGPAAAGLTVTVFADYGGFLLAILPPGAFVGLALLIALKNKLDSVARSVRESRPGPAVAEERAADAC